MVEIEMSIIGEWWFPDNPIRFNGKLSFSSQNGGTLMIYGSVSSFATLDIQNQDENTGQGSAGSEVYENQDAKIIIHGQANNKRKVSALCHKQPLMSTELHDYCERKFLIDFIFLDFYIRKIEDIQFEYLIVEYGNSYDWLNDPDMKCRTLFNPPSKPQILLEFYKGNTTELRIDDTFTISVFSYPNINIDFLISPIRNDHIFVKFKSDDVKTLEKYIELKNHFQDFLNFVISKEVKTERMLGLLTLRGKAQKIPIFYKSSLSQSMDKIKVKSSELFNRQDIGNKIDQVINKWYSLRTNISAVYDLYFGVMYNTELYLSNKFLMLCEALAIYIEIIMERKVNVELGRKMQLIDSVCNVIDESNLNEDDKKWAKNCLKEKRSYSFKEKMEIAYDLFNEILPHLSYTIGSKDGFSSNTKELRNKLTHANLDYDQLNNEDVYHRCKDLQLILQLCILRELEFTNDEIKKMYMII